MNLGSSRIGRRRARHALIALAIAFALSFPNLFYPVDLVLWATQSRLGDRAPSGEIIYVEVAQGDLAQTDGAKKLATTVEALSRGGAKDIYLDLTSAGGAEEFAELETLKGLSKLDNVYLVGRIYRDRNRKELKVPFQADPSHAKMVIASHVDDFMGFVWRVPSEFAVDGNSYDSFGHTLSSKHSNQVIEIDYRIGVEQIPSMRLEDISKSSDQGFDARFSGKSFVFGFVASDGSNAVDIPGALSVPHSYVPILAGESVRKGGVTRIGSDGYDYLPLIATCFLLVFFGTLSSSGGRKAAYILASFCLVTCVVVPVFAPLRIAVSGAIVFLFVFAIFRFVERWRHRINLESDETGLPTMAKLQSDLEALEDGAMVVLVRAKIHNLSEVLTALPKNAKIEYFKGVTNRLSIGRNELTIYSDGGAHFYWIESNGSQDVLRDHLKALCTIFKTPINVGEKIFDAKVTFAADFNYPGEAHKRISTVATLGERASLSVLPIVFGAEPDAVEVEWQASLQSKIDLALEEGDIFPVFQPQIDIENGEVVGFESLVRWKDKERGFISPAYFVQQCEQAGRMDRLQEFMLHKSIEAFQNSEAMDSNAMLSVNMSATQLTDIGAVELVTATVEELGFPAERLVIEITETSKFLDLDGAKLILDPLRNLGAEISLDDFGTGSAGLETLLHLPFTELKIDRLFVSQAVKSEKARSIVEHAIAMGKELDMRVICEGVEDEATLELLKRLGAQNVQGFVFGKPARHINIARKQMGNTLINYS